MRFDSLRALGIAAVLSLAVVTGASAGVDGAGTARQAPVSSEIEAYFAAHGADEKFLSMVEGDLRTYAGLFGAPDYMVIGQDMYSYSNAPSVAGEFSVRHLA